MCQNYQKYGHSSVQTERVYFQMFSCEAYQVSQKLRRGPTIQTKIYGFGLYIYFSQFCSYNRAAVAVLKGGQEATPSPFESCAPLLWLL